MPESPIDERRRVAKAFTSQIKTQQTFDSKQLLDEFDDTDYEETDLVRPPYDLMGLAHFLEVSTEHARCVNQKAVDVISGGWTLDLKTQIQNQAIAGQYSEVQLAEHDRLFNFFDNPNEEQTLEELLTCVEKDYESLGGAYIEIVRTNPTLIRTPDGGLDVQWGDIVKMYHIPGKTIRIRKHDDGYVQKRGIRKRWFRRFGDPAIINSEDGRIIKPEELMQNPRLVPSIATELIPIIEYHPSSDYYGVPEFVPAIGAMVANLHVRDYNISYFDNSAVPLFAVILEGAAWDEETKGTIENFFQHEVRGTMNQHKTLFLELPASRKDEQETKVVLQPLQPAVKDGYFANFRRDNRDEIIRAHSMPPFRIGIVEVANIGTGTGTAQLLNYQQSVVAPRQRKLEARINKMIIQGEAGFKLKHWTWNLTPVDISEKERLALIHERYGKLGAMTINEIRRDIGLPPVVGGDAPFVIAAPEKVTLLPQLQQRLDQLKATASEVPTIPDTSTTSDPTSSSQDTVLSLVSGDKGGTPSGAQSA